MYISAILLLIFSFEIHKPFSREVIIFLIGLVTLQVSAFCIFRHINRMDNVHLHASVICLHIFLSRSNAQIYCTFIFICLLYKYLIRSTVHVSVYVQVYFTSIWLDLLYSVQFSVSAQIYYTFIYICLGLLYKYLFRSTVHVSVYIQVYFTSICLDLLYMYLYMFRFTLQVSVQIYCKSICIC